ncbi:hypothetical protein [Klebsiella pneumoniae]|uniref:hypothetical protein n=1 Tax=Klebsiella pneumoniae TaxID=573 RepID=UPI00081C1804|nr:hypothetical protein [Klebsiella pneumoniae]OCU60184.1 hypothetical protein A6D81_07705 [Klebsiella pneumoniae]
MFAGKKSAQIREILISESAWEEMTCLFAPSLSNEQKDKIINILVDAFEGIFRKYFRDSKNEVKHG